MDVPISVGASVGAGYSRNMTDDSAVESIVQLDMLTGVIVLLMVAGSLVAAKRRHTFGKAHAVRSRSRANPGVGWNP